MGCVVVLGLYFALFSGVVGIAQTARSKFASLLAFGIGAPLFFHVVVNVAMTSGGAGGGLAAAPRLLAGPPCS